jgi:hypothetical protein
MNGGGTSTVAHAYPNHENTKGHEDHTKQNELSFVIRPRRHEAHAVEVE